jgi:hypothetical protein
LRPALRALPNRPGETALMWSWCTAGDAASGWRLTAMGRMQPADPEAAYRNGYAFRLGLPVFRELLIFIQAQRRKPAGGVGAIRHQLVAGIVADLGLFKIKIIMLRRNNFLLQPGPGQAWVAPYRLPRDQRARILDQPNEADLRHFTLSAS